MADQLLNRLKNVLLTDTSTEITSLKKVLKSDLYSLFSQYMVLDQDSIDIDFKTAEDGRLRLNLSVEPARLLATGNTIN